MTLTWQWNDARLTSLAKPRAARRHQVWHKTDRQAYGVTLTQSGKNHKLGIAGWQQCVGCCEQSPIAGQKE